MCPLVVAMCRYRLTPFCRYLRWRGSITVVVLLASFAHSFQMNIPLMVDAVSVQPAHAAARRLLRHMGTFTLLTMPIFVRVPCRLPFFEAIK